jgi:signal transduction histidine kinase
MLPNPHAPWTEAESLLVRELDTFVALACRLTGAGSGALVLPATPTSEPQVITTHGMMMPPSGVKSAWGAAGISRTGTRASVLVPLDDGRVGVLTVADPIAGGAFDEAAVGALRDLAMLLTRRSAPDARASDAVRAREDERRRIAQELHDETGHTLTAAIWTLERSLVQAPADPGAMRAALERARDGLLDYAEALHGVVEALPPRLLDDLGLLGGLEALAAAFAEVDGTEVALSLPARTPAVAPALALAVFRVVQEGLTNIRKHAHASRVALTLEAQPDALVLVLEDDGVGCADAVLPARRPRLGIAGMRERVEALGGSLTIGQRPAGGTRLAAHLPY